MRRSSEAAMDTLELLYREYHQPVLRYLERLAGSRELAEDLAQETFLKALRHWDQLHSADGAVPWLFRIARHTAYDHHRRCRRRPGTPLTELQLETVAASSSGCTFEELEPIQRALSRLSRPHSTVLLLHSYAGYPVEEIAASLGWKLGTVKSRLSRARASFRQHYVA
jgi:RNA polymerase sigma-70 factor, ECF subfamily